MRLTKKYQDIINSKAREFFGHDVHVYLFGSRVDDSKRGGDIDLFIDTSLKESDKLFEKKINYIISLKNLLGEQKFDIVLPSKSNQTFIDMIKEEAIHL
ncbi:MAG: nucleotidyltransferase domain-containing protein [gamma proteobacterium symbiont of Taylorina sp.]|nr:nucleotidyltransferase domain-containing protein [gamma proteobacterium symbiont of Taylorina sp.]